VLVQTSAAAPGAQLDPDGYTVTLDGRAPQAIASNGTITFPDVATGDHVVEMEGLQVNCTTQRTTFSVTVVASQTADVTFPITCWPPTTGRIAFTTNINGAWEIFSVNPDGTDLRQVTHDPPVRGGDFFPAWSPDGWKIAFGRAGSVKGRIAIYVVNADGTGLTALTDGSGEDHEPSWSPDGSKIVFASDRGGSGGIFVMNADGTGLEQLTTSRGYSPSWLPDGSGILYMCRPAENYDACVMNPDGTGIVNITNHPADDWIQGRACSPDGTKIAFTSDRDGHWNIWVMNPDGTNPVNITNSTATEDASGWSPDGTKILFLKNRKLYFMNADGTDKATAIGTMGDAWVLNPDWSHGTGAVSALALTRSLTSDAKTVVPSRHRIAEER
jgi:Tol biopolymer transport system component